MSADAASQEERWASLIEFLAGWESMDALKALGQVSARAGNER